MASRLQLPERMTTTQVDEQIDYCLTIDTDDVIFSVQTALPHRHVNVKLPEVISLLKQSAGFWQLIVWHDGETVFSKVRVVNLNDYTSIPSEHAITHGNRLTKKVIM